MPILSLIKTLLRISGTGLDTVIQFNIDACLVDLEDAGIDIDGDDTMINKAIELYCKWQMNHNGEADRYEKCYRALVNTMSEQETHRVGDEDA